MQGACLPCLRAGRRTPPTCATPPLPLPAAPADVKRQRTDDSPEEEAMQGRRHAASLFASVDLNVPRADV
eukprot:364496-Chlamydomonas_euryale.AAC.3